MNAPKYSYILLFHFVKMFQVKHNLSVSWEVTTKALFLCPLCPFHYEGCDKSWLEFNTDNKASSKICVFYCWIGRRDVYWNGFHSWKSQLSLIFEHNLISICVHYLPSYHLCICHASVYHIFQWSVICQSINHLSICLSAYPCVYLAS